MTEKGLAITLTPLPLSRLRERGAFTLGFA